MTRFFFLMVGLALVGVSGCAQCDTCDDFPAPCTGPNCGQNGYATGGFIPPTQAGLPQEAALTSAPSSGYDAAPSMENTSMGGTSGQPSPTMPPASDPAGNSPPLPTTP